MLGLRSQFRIWLNRVILQNQHNFVTSVHHTGFIGTYVLFPKLKAMGTQHMNESYICVWNNLFPRTLKNLEFDGRIQNRNRILIFEKSWLRIRFQDIKQILIRIRIHNFNSIWKWGGGPGSESRSRLAIPLKVIFLQFFSLYFQFPTFQSKIEKSIFFTRWTGSKHTSSWTQLAEIGKQIFNFCRFLCYWSRIQQWQLNCVSESETQILIIWRNLKMSWKMWG